MKRVQVSVLSLVLAIALMVDARAVSFIENVDGDLSDVAGTPTLVTLELGSNTIAGSTGGGDDDFLRINVPVGLELSQITLSAYGGASSSFVGVQNGTTWTEATGGDINPANLLGWSHFGVAHIGTDILDNIGNGGNGATGFTPPLVSADYTFILQDTGGAVSYDLAFVAATVPEPETYALVTGLALVGGLAIRRYRIRCA